MAFSAARSAEITKPSVTERELSAGLPNTGDSMQQKQSAWQVAKAQAANIKMLKSPIAKRRQIVLWCQMVKKAMKGGA